MAKILISTTCRHTTPKEPSGFLYVYDVENRKIIKKSEIIEPPHRDADPNPRGGFRGLKGLSIRNDKLALANASTVFIYDNNWELVSCFWHPSCAGIHDIKLMDDCIWVTSSSNDLLFCFTFDGEIIKHYDLRKFPVISERAKGQIKPFLSEKKVLHGLVDFRNPRTHDNNFTDLLHVNSVDILSNGDLIVSCGLFRNITRKKLHKINHSLRQIIFLGLSYRLYVLYEKYLKPHLRSDKAPREKTLSTSLLIRINDKGVALPCLALNNVKVPSHSIRILNDDSAVYLNSTTNELIHFNPTSSNVMLIKKVGNTFLRGVERLPDQSLVIGDNNHIVHFDLFKQEIIHQGVLSNNSIEAVYDIVSIPEGFSNPPDSFITHHQISQV